MRRARKLPHSIVIAGGGLSGSRVAATLLAHDFAGDITIVGAESGAAYERPAVSKHYLAGTRSRSDIALALASDSSRITRHHDAVAHVDGARGTVYLASGVALAADAVVIATGAQPRQLDLGDLGLPIANLRTPGDADAVNEYLANAAAPRAIIIGAGFIGSEAAATLAKKGVEVHVVEPAHVPLMAHVGQQLAGNIAAELGNAGVTVHGGRTVAHWSQAPRGVAVTLDNGTYIDADVAIVAVGSIVRTPQIAGVARSHDSSVVTDNRGRSSVVGIHACGDAAAWWWDGLDAHRRIEHWAVADGQARTVALDLLGREAQWDEPPYFWSDIGGVRIQRIGHAHEGGDFVNDRDDDHVTWMHDARGAISGVIAIDRPAEIARVRNALKRGEPVTARSAA